MARRTPPDDAFHLWHSFMVDARELDEGPSAGLRYLVFVGVAFAVSLAAAVASMYLVERAASGGSPASEPLRRRQAPRASPSNGSCMGEAGTDDRSLPHVPALDGVRGLAVVAVLVYHAQPSWLPGGLLGVTVFFTLSGFLITSLLIRELEATGGIELRRFWVRRARRLVPASVATVALVALLAAVGLHAATSGLVADAAAALTWTANWRFVADGSSYASLFRDPSPLQHFWSLAVEEQVYVVLPVISLVLLGRRARRRTLFAGFLVVCIAGSTVLAATLHGAGDAAGRAYYGTDARLAEPFVGALLAAVLARGGGFLRLDRAWARVAGLAGCVALAGIAVLSTQLSTTDARLYDGGFLLTALLAAVVLVAATQPTAIARALSFAPLARLGTISYGVYLFHWPLFEWFDDRLRGTDHLMVVAVEVSVTIALAAVSHALLEMPIRLRRRGSAGIFATGWANASVAALAAVVLVTATPASGAAASAVDLGIGVDDAVPPPPVVALQPAPALAAARPPTTSAQAVPGRTTSTAPAEPVTPEEAELLTGGDDWSEGRSSAPPETADSRLRVAVIGDSLAHNAATGLAAWAAERTDVVVYDLSVSFCPLSRGGERRWSEGESFDVNAGCAWWDDPTSERARNLAAFAPNVIVDEAGFSEMLDRLQPDWDDWSAPGDGDYHSWLLDEYDSLFTALRGYAGTDVRFLSLNLPCGDFGRPRGWRRVTGPDDRVHALDSYVYPLMSRSAQGDLFQQLCPNGEYTDDLWGISDARPDGMHLSDEAAAELARRWLGPLVLQVGGLGEPTGVLATPVPGT
jgi:peptidoglycan/LPS O-acetylase OafA/YrhL